MGWVKIILLAVILAVCLFFFQQNTDQVTIRFGLSPLKEYHFFELSKIPLYIVILCSIILGILVGGLWDLYRRFQLGRSIRQKQKTIERLEKEIQSLRGPDLAASSSLKKEG